MPVVVLACQAGSLLFRRIGQPPVVGEILTGVLLGPSLLGFVWPAGQSLLFPASVLPTISALGNVGLLVFMFLIGCELDVTTLRGNSRTALAVSQASILLPLILGSVLALTMFTSLAPPGTGRTPFVLFVAVSMSITAFPVLARILTDRGLHGTAVGTLAMAAAAVNDLAAWFLLALIAALAGSGSLHGVLVTIALTTAFVLVTLYAVRPLVARSVRRAPRTMDHLVLVILFGGLCLAGLTTESIGVHAQFGAFLFGVAMPRRSRVVERATTGLHTFVLPLLLPLFFVGAGLQTNFARLAGTPELWVWAPVTTGVAVLGKWGGGTCAARACGQNWQDAMSIGALMNSRGLTELIVLGLGLQLGVISTPLYSLLVLMALITTVLTAPSLSWIRRTFADADDGGAGTRGEIRVPQGRAGPYAHCS